MPSTLDAAEHEPTFEVDYVPGVQGHAVLAVGPDGAGVDALAFWSLGPYGRAGGAWILPLATLHENTERLRNVMGMIRGTCVTDWTVDRPLEIVEKLDGLLPERMVAALRDNIVVVPDLLDEIAEERKTYADAVEAYRATAKSKIVPLVWPSEVPEPRALADWATASQQRFAASPVAGQALALTAAVARAVELWQETEQLRYRRAYLRSFGEPRSLPPRWLARLRAANAPGRA